MTKAQGNATAGAESAAPGRNLGIDLLRIVATFAILVLHVLGQGGVLEHTSPLSGRYEGVWLLETMTYFGVAAYGLISGYVAVERRFKLANLVRIYLTVFFYTFCITMLFAICLPGSVGREEFIAMFFPAMTEQYWYYSAYLGMFFFIPMMNHAILTFYRKYVHLTLAAFVLMFSVFPVFFSTDVFGLRGGYSFVALMLFYFIGAYLKHFDLLRKLTGAKLILLYVLSVLLTWSFKLMIELSAGYASYESGHSMRLLAYNSPTILVSAVALLLLFSKLNVPEKLVRSIKILSPLCFGVYLSNCHPLVWKYLMKDRFAKYASFPLPVLILTVLLSAAAIFIVGALIDEVRHLAFEMGGLRKRLDRLEEKIFEKKDKV